MSLIRRSRIFLLSFVLAVVALGSWLSHARLTDWDDTVWVAVYPIAGDGNRATARYVSAMTQARLRPIERFFNAQARRHHLRLRQPVKVLLGPVIDELPPQPPQSASVLSVMWWSLQFRYWAWQHVDADIPAGISLFVIYHDPQLNPAVPHSLGLKEGHIGTVHAFADAEMTQANNVVIAHELLHTLGATDKYDLVTDQPYYPQGFADPDRKPRYPQERAEIMAGRIPLGPRQSAIPDNLRQTVLNGMTASEIGWLETGP